MIGAAAVGGWAVVGCSLLTLILLTVDDRFYKAYYSTLRFLGVAFGQKTLCVGYISN